MAANGYFIRELTDLVTFAENTAFAVEDDVGPDSYFTTGLQMRTYFQTSGFEDAASPVNFTLGTGAGEDISGATGCIAIGYDAMKENVTGGQNTCLGYEAGKGVAGNSHSNNTFIGYQSGLATTVAVNNVVIGSGAKTVGATGNNQVVIGYLAAPSGRASNTISIGYATHTSLTSGAGNVAIGAQADRNNVTGTLNTCVGNEAGKGSGGASHIGNTFVGYRSGFAITSGQRNTCTGNASGSSITTGAFNCFFGELAGASITTQSFVTAVGYQALTSATGAGNTGIGTTAGSNNVTGTNNTYLGSEAGRGVAANSHSDNTFIGYQSGTAITTGGTNCCLGSGSGNLLTEGDANVFLGMNAGSVFTTGSGNICLGANVGLSETTAGSSDQLFIHNDDLDEDAVIIYGEMTETAATQILKLNARVRITEPDSEVDDARCQLDVVQTTTDRAEPVLILDQDDVSEEFIRFYGSAAAATLTQSIVDEGDQASETREGWIKINIQDEGDQVADGAYYIPFYSLSS